MNAAVSLQVSLAPSDLPYALHVLPHQLRQWGGQVDEIVLAVDTRPGTGRFADAWHERRPGLYALLDEVARSHRHARIVEVDYGDAARERIATRFFGGAEVPLKDHLGGPYYCYFAGLEAVANDLVLHLDSDMLFGGGSQTWVAEAVATLHRDSELIACSPLPGPPTSDGSLRSQTAERYPASSTAFRFARFSTRVYLLSLASVAARLGPLPIRRPGVKKAMLAALAGSPVTELPEIVITKLMAGRGLGRVDLLGHQPGMWSVHPRWRSQAFFDALPSIIERVETGDVPDEQRGRYDVHDSLFPWGDAPRLARRRRARSMIRR